MKVVFIHVPRTAGTSLHFFLHSHPEIQLETALNHRPISQVGGFGKLGFRVAFVRNTWTWVADHYATLKNLEDIGIVGKSDDRAYTSFPFFVQYFVQHAKPQSWYITYHGRSVLNFMGRFENLDADVERLCEVLKVEYWPLAVRHSEVQKYKHLDNQREPFEADDLKALYDPKTKALVERAFAEDIERFGFIF